MSDTKQPFESWLKELRELLVNKYEFPATESAEIYGTAEDWKFYYEIGYTPDEAINAEFKHL